VIFESALAGLSPLLAQASAEAVAQVGRGRIVGGWEYVWASYAIAWTSVTLYALSLYVRRPRADAQLPKE
jgi:hypothetical protein